MERDWGSTMNIIKNAKNIVTAKLCETLELEINGQVYKVDKMIIDYFRLKELEYAKMTEKEKYELRCKYCGIRSDLEQSKVQLEKLKSELDCIKKERDQLLEYVHA